MRNSYANGRSMAQILGLIKPGIGEETGKERAEALYKKRLARLRKMEADQKAGKVLSTGRPFDCAQGDNKGVRYGQVTNNQLSIPAQTTTSFVPYITSVAKQCLQPMGVVARLMTLLIFVPVCLLNSALAQSSTLRPSSGGGAADGPAVVPLGLGRNVPEDFWTKEHLFFFNGDTVRRTLEEHRGKMLVLDFWFSGCFNCLLHQQEIAYYRELYADELAVIMVNSRSTKEDYEKILRFTDSKVFKNLGLTDFTSIIEDEYLEAMFVHYGFPHYAWINGRGVFQLQTFRNLLDRDYRTPFIDKKQ